MNDKLPLDIHYTEDVCVILSDISTAVVTDFRAILRQYPHADGMRDVSICTSYKPTDVTTLRQMITDGECSWASIGWLIFSPPFAAAAREKGLTVRAYADELYDQCDEINQSTGYRAAWIEAYGEIGNSITWPKGKTFTKKEALAYFREWMTNGRSLTEHWRQLTSPALPNFYTHAKDRSESLRKLPIYYSEGTLFALHEAYRLGFPLVAYEGQCGTQNAIQAGIAFVRGGAKMHDALWGCDFSPWTGAPLGELAQVTADGSWGEGMTADYMLRTWIAAYMSGCNTLLHEVGYTFFFAQPREGLVTLTEYGFNAMRFYALKESVLAERGRAVSPIALMLEEAHGYRGDMVREYTEQGELTGSSGNETPQQRIHLWQNRTPGMSRGDWQIHRLLTHIWPLPDNAWGCAARNWPDESIPAFDRAIASRLHTNQEDPRDYARFLSDSRWADCFDVINETACADVLSRYYQAIILAGEINTGNGLWERLASFMAGGGTVLTSANQLHESLRVRLGIAEQPCLTVISPLISGQRLAGIKHSSVESIELPLFTCTVADGISVVAEDAITHTPLALALPSGAGRLIVTLISYGLDVQAKRIDPIFDSLINDLYEQLVGVKYVGKPIQMLVNKTDHDLKVTLLNHTGRTWIGEIVVSNLPACTMVWDVIGQMKIPQDDISRVNKSIAVKASVPAFGFKVLALGRQMPDYRKTWPEVGSSLSDDSVKKLQVILKEGAEAIIR